MNFRDATILITGGNSGIGRGLAEALADLGAKIIITGRDKDRLDDVVQANPGMSAYELDVTSSLGINTFAAQVTTEHPELNAVIHNAGILAYESVLGGYDMETVEKVVLTNLIAPIGLTSALLPHLRAMPEAAIVTVSSGLAFVPLASASAYSASKAGMHSWSQSLRHELRSTNISVVEIAPPLVATELTPGQSRNPHAMPLDAFIEEAVGLLCADVTPEEVIVQRAIPQRTAERAGQFKKVFDLINPN
ncbi:SDR family oxidoreductase [Rhizobium sp. CC-YZS058]|uniref:SDR family oxidoreductase n=1 Tax=Rhizobium sp. CC-YZS058 TaxID=3042153 RepID=UPI002B058CB3|nr:SDR family NAD(P)-dependent oxidoreductase [Rhizobium sp. CC-YZS058]MEA3537002.1 SDR family NAD(P)-dependent oxidoreductase [Rhizobium sp. CC-YZS058]